MNLFSAFKGPIPKDEIVLETKVQFRVKHPTEGS